MHGYGMKVFWATFSAKMWVEKFAACPRTRHVYYDYFGSPCDPELVW